LNSRPVGLTERVVQRNRVPTWGILANVDVVDTSKLDRLRAVYLDYQPVCCTNVRWRVPDRGGRNEPALADGDCFDDRNRLAAHAGAEPAKSHLVGEPGYMTVVELDLPVIDGRTRCLVRYERIPPHHVTGLDQIAVNLVADAATGDDGEFAVVVGRRHRLGNEFRVADAAEAGDEQRGRRRDECSRRCGRGDREVTVYSGFGDRVARGWGIGSGRWGHSRFSGWVPIPSGQPVGCAGVGSA
jgi:hypothetical protein